ncbi:flotillin family protein [Vibrio owensii]|uniref:flotillin family protein n=1 Tax=Vibrio owensii TaxID=696485 RepID=UPI003CC58538
MDLGSLFSGVAFIAVPIVLVVFLMFMLMAYYKRCKPNEVLVIYGKTTGKKSSKTVHGGGAFVVPLLQDYSYLSLEPISFDVDLKKALSSNNIRLNIPSTFTVAVSTESEVLSCAAERLLGLELDMIREKAQEIAIGQLRQVIASMTIEEINRDRDSFNEKVNSGVAEELAKIGLAVINVNIKDITDESGYLDAIGQKAAQSAIQQANIDVAEQTKKGEIGQAKALREQQVTVIAEQAESAKAQEKTTAERDIFIAEQNAERKRGENEASAKEAEFDASLRIAQAQASETSEVREQKARKAIEESREEAELAARRVEEVVDQKIEAEKAVVEAEGIAKAIEVKAKADANALLVKYEAEAEGLRKVMEAKAEGYQKLIEASGQNAPALLLIEKMEEIMRIQMEAIKEIKIDKITVWDGGNGNGENGLKGFVKDFATMAPQLHELAGQAGIKLPSFMGEVAQDPTLLTAAVEKLSEGKSKVTSEKKTEK